MAQLIFPSSEILPNNMTKKELYKQQNEDFLSSLSSSGDVMTLYDGILYRVLESGAGQGTVTPSSIVTCHYKGKLINGKVFDNSWERSCPEAFRVNDLIEGFQIALCHMHIGDHWEIYIPWNKGYGKRSDSDIPGYSTLIFEIHLFSIA